MTPILSKAHSDALSEIDDHALTLLRGNFSNALRDGFSQVLNGLEDFPTQFVLQVTPKMKVQWTQVRTVCSPAEPSSTTNCSITKMVPDPAQSSFRDMGCSPILLKVLVLSPFIPNKSSKASPELR